MKYFKAGGKLLAFNAKVGTATLCLMIIKQYQPEEYKTISEADYPEGKTFETILPHQWVAKRFNPNAPVCLLVRDPVERFKSAMAFTRVKNVNETLDELENEEGPFEQLRRQKLAQNIHFQKQNQFEGDITLFRFPDQLQDAAKFLGLTEEVPHKNKSKEEDKPELTEEQIERIEAWYADDVALWESIQE